jgi:hypothetical protein
MSRGNAAQRRERSIPIDPAGVVVRACTQSENRRNTGSPGGGGVALQPADREVAGWAVSGWRVDKTHFVLSHAQPNPLEDSRALAISLLTKLRVLSPPCGTPGKRDKTLATNFHCHFATRSLAHALTCSFPLSPRRAGGSSHEIFGAFGAFAVQSPPRGSADNICGQLASLSGQRHCRILCRHSSPRAPCVQPLSRFKYENSMFSGLFAFQMRHSLFALDEKSFIRPPDHGFPHAEREDYVPRALPNHSMCFRGQK